MPGKIGDAADQVAPPSVDLLNMAVTWQPLLVRAGQRPPELLCCDDQATYRSPFGAAAPAGKLLTRKAVFAGGIMSWTSAIFTGLLKVAPPSVDLTIHSLSRVASRVAPSKITYSVPSGPTIGREPWS